MTFIQVVLLATACYLGVDPGIQGKGAGWIVQNTSL